MSDPRRLLMIAYHFPPLAGSSGIQRTLRFVQHLPAFGWQPLVLTTVTQAYERTSADLVSEVPQDTVVRRAFAFDAARQLSFCGRHFAALSRPDRWMSWRFDAVRVGMQMIREFKPHAIWSTFPIATAHVIGAALQRKSGLPWIADFRDPMAQEGYPADPKTWAMFKRIEEIAMKRARLGLFTTRGAAGEYRARYPESAQRIGVLENGYDEDSFVAAAAKAPPQAAQGKRPMLVVHSGIVYADERNPRQLMQALRRLHDGGVLGPDRLKLRMRAPVHEDLLRSLVLEHGVDAYVEVEPPIPYLDALREMLEADALLALQASNSNQQIPAKVYEYLRAGRPIIGLTDSNGETAAVLRQAGVERTARLDSVDEIAALLQHYLQYGGQGLIPHREAVAAASRRARTEELAQWLDRL